jgi:hypothetical protein
VEFSLVRASLPVAEGILCALMCGGFLFSREGGGRGFLCRELCHFGRKWSGRDGDGGLWALSTEVF